MNKNPSLTSQMFSGPTPGQSLTHEPKSQPWEKPPQFTQLSDAMNFLMEQITQPIHLKQMLAIMDAGMPIEAIARTIIFSGFSLGKWNPDLGMLMYKPTMLSLIALAHRAGLKDTPVVMPSSLDKHIKNRSGMHAMAGSMNQEDKPIPIPEEDKIDNKLKASGFAKKVT